VRTLDDDGKPNGKKLMKMQQVSICFFAKKKYNEGFVTHFLRENSTV